MRLRWNWTGAVRQPGRMSRTRPVLLALISGAALAGPSSDLLDLPRPDPFISVGSRGESSADIGARLPEDDGYAGATAMAEHVVEWDHLPAHDFALSPGEVEVVPRPLEWARRREAEVLLGRTTAWPPEVCRVLEERARERFRARTSGDDSVAERDYAFRTFLPGGLALFALGHGDSASGSAMLSLALHHPATGTIGAPLTVGRRWSGFPARGPLAWTADLDGDGRPELAIDTHYHNGTVEDGRVYAWLEVGAALELVPLERTLRYDEVRGVSRGECGRIHGRLVREPGGVLRRELWYQNLAYGVSPRTVPPSRADAFRARSEQDERIWNPLPRVR